MTTDDPLAALLVDAAALDRKRIVDALDGRLALDGASGTAVVLPRFEDLSARQKVLAMLLARKAAALLAVATDDALSSTELRDQSGMAGGTVRRLLPELAGEHLATQGSDSRYHLTNPQVHRAIKELEGEPGARAGRKGSSRRRPRPEPKAEAKPSAEEATGSTVKAKRSTRLGPATFLAELIANGFFSEPRAVADVQREIRDRRGYQVPTNNLTPQLTRLLRRGELSRERDESGTYRYTKGQVGG